MRQLFTLCLLLLPAVVQGADDRLGGGSFGFFAGFLQMLAALALVLGLILLTYYGVTRLMRKLPPLRPGNQHIRILEVRAMGPRKALILIEIGGEYLLLSSSHDRLSLIKQIDMIEPIEVLEEPAARPSFLSFLKRETSRP